MRRIFGILTVVSLLIFPSGIVAQMAKSEPTTKLGSFISKRGRLLIRHFFDIGTVYGRSSGVKCQALIVYEPGNKRNAMKGLKFTIKQTGRYDKTENAFLDYDEVESLIKAIEYMVKIASEWQGKNRPYTEVYFVTKDDFKVGFYQSDELRQVGFASAGSIRELSCFFDCLTGLNELLKIARSGLATLQQE